MEFNSVRHQSLIQVVCQSYFNFFKAIVALEDRLYILVFLPVCNLLQEPTQAPSANVDTHTPTYSTV